MDDYEDLFVFFLLQGFYVYEIKQGNLFPVGAAVYLLLTLLVMIDYLYLMSPSEQAQAQLLFESNIEANPENVTQFENYINTLIATLQDTLESTADSIQTLQAQFENNIDALIGTLRATAESKMQAAFTKLPPEEQEEILSYLGAMPKPLTDPV